MPAVGYKGYKDGDSKLFRVLEILQITSAQALKEKLELMLSLEGYTRGMPFRSEGVTMFHSYQLIQLYIDE